MTIPIMRRATRRERLFRLVFGYWPASFVNARLDYANAIQRDAFEQAARIWR